MPTLRECIAELRARQARLDEAEKRGWGDCIPAERETVSEFRHHFDAILDRNMDALLAVAGDLDLGPLPSWIGLHYSGQEPDSQGRTPSAAE